MKRIIIALCASLALAGCGTTGGLPASSNFSILPSIANLVTDTRFASIEASYGVALASANVYIQNYRDGNRCTVTKPESVSNLCSRRSVVSQMQSAIRVAQASVLKAKGFISRNPNLDATSVLDAAVSSISVLRQISDQ
jgi:fructose-1,6-bisphosphatase